MAEIVLQQRTPEARQAYALGMRAAAEVMSYWVDNHPWWIFWTLPAVLRRALDSIHISADLMEDFDAQEHCTATGSALEEPKP